MSGFNNILDDMRTHGMRLPQQKIQIAVPHAATILRKALEYFVAMEGRTLVWLPEYDEVARWLSGNRGRGLFMYGSCGRGKTLLCRYVLPAIILKHCRKVVSIFDMNEVNKNIDAVLTKHIISLDDVGTEALSIQYGQRRMAFAEILDAAEKDNKLLIASSNLNVSEIVNHYDDRVLDRLKSTTVRILFQGDSLRA